MTFQPTHHPFGFLAQDPLQALIAGAEKQRQVNNGEQGIITVDDLLLALTKLPDLPVFADVPSAKLGDEDEFYSTGCFGPGLHPIARFDNLQSYRGYYSDAYLPIGEDDTDPISADDLRCALMESYWTVVYGWKGGEYTITPKTPVWASQSGHTGGIMVTGAYATDDRVILSTAREMFPWD